MLGSAQENATQYLRDAFISLETENYPGAIEHFKDVGRYARTGFNQTEAVENLIFCTELKITACFVEMSYEDNQMKMLADLSPLRQREMSRKIAGHLDDLISKVKAVMAGLVKSAKKAKINKKKAITDARDKVMGISEKMDGILAKAYPVIVQGQGIVNPLAKVSKKTSEDLIFTVVPKYLPESESAAVLFRIASTPEITIRGYRKLLMDNELEVSSHIVTWRIAEGKNYPLHQDSLDRETRLSEHLKLRIPLDELKKVFADWKAAKAEGGLSGSTKSRRKTVADPTGTVLKHF